MSTDFDTQMPNPRVKREKDRVIVEKVGAELVIYDLENRKCHALNETATEIWQALAKEFPDDPDYQKNLAIVKSHASRFLEVDDRLKAYQETVDVLAALAERYPERIEYRQLMIQFVSGLSNELQAIGKLEEAERHFLHAIRIADAFSKTNPELPLYHEAAGQFTAFGDLSRQLGKFKQSAEAHQTAVQNAVDLVRMGAEDFLEKPFPQARLLKLLDSLARTHSD